MYGSFSLDISPENFGAWKDFENGPGGGGIEFVMQHFGISHDQVCDSARNHYPHEFERQPRKPKTNGKATTAAPASTIAAEPAHPPPAAEDQPLRNIMGDGRGCGAGDRPDDPATHAALAALVAAGLLTAARRDEILG